MLLWFCLRRLKDPLGFCGAHSYWLKESIVGLLKLFGSPLMLYGAYQDFNFARYGLLLAKKDIWRPIEIIKAVSDDAWGYWDHIGHNKVIWDLLRAFGGILWSFVGPIKSLSCWIRLYCVSKSPFKALWKQIKWILGLKRCFIGGRRSLVDPMRLFESPVFSHGAC